MKRYLVDDIIITTDKDMTGFPEAPDFEPEPCNILVELVKKNQKEKNYGSKD